MSSVVSTWLSLFSPSAHLPASNMGQKDGQKEMSKTYNSGDSPVVTHPSTNPPVSCLSTAERTGSAVCQNPMVVCEGMGSFDVYIGSVH